MKNADIEIQYEWTCEDCSNLNYALTGEATGNCAICDAEHQLYWPKENEEIK